MPRRVFDKIRSAIEGKGMFAHRRDALKINGVYPLQRITASVKMLA